MIVELVVAFLLLASGALVLTAALGLWRLDDFFLRMHAPALANSTPSVVSSTPRVSGLPKNVRYAAKLSPWSPDTLSSTSRTSG